MPFHLLAQAATTPPPQQLVISSWLFTALVSIALAAVGAGIGFAAAFGSLRSTVNRLVADVADLRKENGSCNEFQSEMKESMATLSERVRANQII